MITNDKAQKDYKSARKALNKIAHSLTADDDQIKAARKAREDLIDNYIGQQIEAVEKRTAQYVSFIETMEKIFSEPPALYPVLDISVC